MLNYLKTAILTVALLILGLIGYILFTFDSEYESRIALDAFLKGDHAKAEEIIKRLSLDGGHSHLYLAYLSRARREMPLSDEHLTLAAQRASGSLALEIALNQAYNGYLSGDKKVLQKGLSAAAELDSENPWIDFFTALNSNEPRSLGDFPYLSPWMKKSFESSFTPFWNMLQKARNEIADGQTLKARERLEQITNTDATEAAELQLLLGLSYLKEAETVSPIAATPYYKLAFAYFGRVPLQSQRFNQDREFLIKTIGTQIAQQIEHGRYQELAFYSNALEALNAPPEIYHAIRHSALKSMLEMIPIDAEDLILTLAQIDIWLKLEQDAKARHAFALALMSLAENLWIEQPGKALQLSLTAASIPALSEQKALQKRVDALIQNTPAKKEPPSYLAQLALKNCDTFLSAFSSPHPGTFLEIGNTCYTLGQPCEARMALLRAIELTHSQEYLKTALPLIAEIEMGLGLNVEAWRHLSEYHRLFPEEMAERSRYARLSMEMQRYDVALKDWQTLEKSGRLSDNDRVDYIASLIHTDQPDLAAAKAKNWKNLLKLAHQLEIARWLLIAGNLDFTEPSDISDARAQIAQLALYRAQADFEKAERLAASAKEQLSRSPQGLFALAELQNDLSNRKVALQLAQQAILLDPNNRPIKAFLEPYQTIAEIESRLEKIIGLLLIFPDSPSLQLQQAQALIDLHLSQNDNPSVLRQANLILDSLLQNNRDLPLLHYLKGETLLLLDQPLESREAFLNATNLDPSYTQACHYLGIVCESLDKPDEALQAMRQSLKYKPQDAQAWIELALLNERLGQESDALHHWQQVVIFQPRNSMAYYQIGRISYRLEDIENARGALEKALEINPQNAKARKLLLIIDSSLL